jgi:hypothetical protein
MNDMMQQLPHRSGASYIKRAAPWPRAQVGATNVRPLRVPHLALNAQFSSCYLAQQQQEPLQFLADALAVCADQELHPTTALALLLSAASIPTAPAAPSPALQKALAPAGAARHAGAAAAAAMQGQVSPG